MALNIDEKALNYISQKGKAATILYSKKGWCHTGTVGVPIVYLGNPKNNLEDYETVRYRQIVIYVHKRINLEEDFVISLSKLFIWHKLTLEGGKLSNYKEDFNVTRK